jgi:NodT family efflux transporter outer membrane factor (OMF) lipoprotein
MQCRSIKTMTISLCIACWGIALASCASDLGPRREIPRAAQFESSASLPAGTQPWPSVSWWRDFGDPQLDQLIDEAVANSPTTAQAGARIQIARAEAIGARAALLPSVGALGAVQETRISQNIGLPTRGDWDGLGATLLNGSFEIDFWGKNRAALEAATSEGMAARADAASARLTLASKVASAYVDFARLEARHQLAASALTVRTRTRDLVAVRIRAGTAAKQDLEQADSALQAATVRLWSTDESIRLAAHMIAALVGAGPDRGDRLIPPVLVNRRNPELPSDLPLGLVGRKPELVAARWRAEAASERINRAKAAYYPNVNLVAAFGVVSLGLDKLFREGSELGSAGPAISVPIFDGGHLEAGFRGARGEYDLAVASYQDVLLQSLQAAADAVVSLKALPSQTDAANAAESKAQSAYDLTKLRYEGGLAGYDSVLISEDALITARDVSTTLRLRGFQLDIALANALGGGFNGAIPAQGSP